MPKYHIWTIGCQMNKADSTHIAGYLEQIGYSSTESIEQADLVVLNSCMVRQSAENKVINKLAWLKGLKLRRKDVAIVVTGCLVDSRIEELQACFPHVDLFFKPQDWETLCQWGENRGIGGQRDNPIPDRSAVSDFVTIMQGCDNYCSYCVVPYRRGREKSREMDDIACEVQGLVERGAKEITLLGQNVDSYGRDLQSMPDLADLLTELKHPLSNFVHSV